MSDSTASAAVRTQHPSMTVYGALLAVQLFFGINYYATKIVLREIVPGAWAGLRITSAALLLLAFHTLFVRRYPSWRDCLWLLLFAVFGVMLNQILFIEGLARTTPAHSAIIGTTIPVMTLIFAAMLGGEWLRPLKVIGIAFSLGGVWWLLGVGSLHFDAEQRLGDILSLLNCAAFAFFLAISRRVISKYDAITATTFLMVFGAVGIDLICLRQLNTFFTSTVEHVSWSGWGHAVYIVIFPTVITYGLNYWALKRVDASVVAVFIYVQPVIATVLSVLMLGDTVTLRMIGSTALIFSGVFLSSPQAQQWIAKKRVLSFEF